MGEVPLYPGWYQCAWGPAFPHDQTRTIRQIQAQGPSRTCTKSKEAKSTTRKARSSLSGPACLVLRGPDPHQPPPTPAHTSENTSSLAGLSYGLVAGEVPWLVSVWAGMGVSAVPDILDLYPASMYDEYLVRRSIRPICTS